MQSYTCELVLASLPRFLKTCPRCKSAAYDNSGRFRVNANGKRLDIWLICRCTHCKTIWNMSIYERVDRATLAAADLSKYFANDVSLNLRHVFDPAFLQKNHATLDLEHLSLTPQGEFPAEGAAAEVYITSEYPLPIPVSRAIELV
ncbi:MAG: DUF1062 domain-containing protein, partial [Eubacteriales bacterium]|nr:DUF1062 domain-containing protein [Eubacteriales bacterium]